MNRLAGATILLATLTLPGPLPAQTVWLAGTGTRVTWETVSTDGETAQAGFMLGGTGGIAWGLLSLEAGYAEGRLGAAGAAAPDPVLVEAFAALRIHPIGGLAVGAGPYARAHVTDAEARRWWTWQLRGRYEVPLLVPRLSAYGELWSALAGGGPNAPDGVRGGSAGVVVAIEPFALRFAYSIDDARVDATGRHETVERLTFAIGWGRP